MLVSARYDCAHMILGRGDARGESGSRGDQPRCSTRLYRTPISVFDIG